MRALAAIVAALALAACAGGGSGPVPGLEARPDGRQDAGVITDRGSPRDRARAHTDLAAAYFESGNMGVALEEIRIALAADATYAPAYNVLGLVHMDLKEHREAEESFERALSIAPNDPNAHHNYGWFLCQTGREELAVKHFLAAVRNPLYATPEKSYTLAGLCALRRKDTAEAQQHLERALKLQPNYVPAVLPLAQLRFGRGELDTARSLVARYNRLAEPTAESLWLALRIERKLGDKAAESGYAEQLRRRFAASAEYRSLQKGDYE